MAWARRRPDISERAAIIGNWEWCAADTPDERRESTHGGMIYEDHFLGSGRNQLVYVLLGAMPVGFVAVGLVAGNPEDLHTETQTYKESRSFSFTSPSVSGANVTAGIASFSFDAPAVPILLPVLPRSAQPRPSFPAALRVVTQLSAVSDTANVTVRATQSQRRPGAFRTPGHSIRGQF